MLDRRNLFGLENPNTEIVQMYSCQCHSSQFCWSIRGIAFHLVTFYETPLLISNFCQIVVNPSTKYVVYHHPKVVIQVDSHLHTMNNCNPLEMNCSHSDDTFRHRCQSDTSNTNEYHFLIQCLSEHCRKCNNDFAYHFICLSVNYIPLAKTRLYFENHSLIMTFHRLCDDLFTECKRC